MATAPNLRPHRPKQRSPGPELVPALHWTETQSYRRSLEETRRMAVIERRREAELIREAEHEAERRAAARKAEGD